MLDLYIFPMLLNATRSPYYNLNELESISEIRDRKARTDAHCLRVHDQQHGLTAAQDEAEVGFCQRREQGGIHEGIDQTRTRRRRRLASIF